MGTATTITSSPWGPSATMSLYAGPAERRFCLKYDRDDQSCSEPALSCRCGSEATNAPCESSTTAPASNAASRLPAACECGALSRRVPGREVRRARETLEHPGVVVQTRGELRRPTGA